MKKETNSRRDSSNWCLCERSIFLKRRKIKQNKFQADFLPNLLLLWVWFPIEIAFSIEAAKIFFFVNKKTDWIDNRSKIFQLLLMIQFIFIATMILTTFLWPGIGFLFNNYFLNEYVWQSDFWQFHSKTRHVFNIIAILMHLLLVVNGFNSECLHFLNFQKRK